MIVGGTYIPHENSKYPDDPDLFDVIANDCILFKSIYNGALIYLVGDSYTITNTLSDLFDSEEFKMHGTDSDTLYNDLNSKHDLDLYDMLFSVQPWGY